jgi:hypothetical protein
MTVSLGLLRSCRVGEVEEKVAASRSVESGLKGCQRFWCPYRTLLF